MIKANRNNHETQKSMTQQKKAGLVGGMIALAYFIFNIYHAIQISQGFSFKESLLHEILTAIVVLLLLLGPAVALTLNKQFKKEHSWIAWLYPAVLALGLLNVILSKDALAAGLPMVLLVIPFCIVCTLVLAFKK